MIECNECGSAIKSKPSSILVDRTEKVRAAYIRCEHCGFVVIGAIVTPSIQQRLALSAEAYMSDDPDKTIIHFGYNVLYKEFKAQVFKELDDLKEYYMGRAMSCIYLRHSELPQKPAP